MKRVVVLGSLCLSWLVPLRSYAAPRKFSVEDSIRMQRFNGQSLDSQGAVAIANDSPNGRYSVVLTSKGLVDSDEIASTLWLVNYRKLRSKLSSPRLATSVAPSALATIAAPPMSDARGTGVYGSVISNVQWSADSGSVYFLGENHQGNRQLYRVSIHSRIQRALTSVDQDVESFSLVGTTIFYRASRATSSVDSPRKGKEFTGIVRVATGLPIVDILAGSESDRLRSYDLWRLESGRRELILKSPPLERESSYLLAQPIAMSPDKHYAIMLMLPRSIPLSWEQYETPTQFDILKLNHLDERPISPYNNVNPLREYVLVDVKQHKAVAIGAVDARYFNFAGIGSVTWAEDSKHVAITNVFLPPERMNSEIKSRIHPCEAAIVDVDTRTNHCLAIGGSASSAPVGSHLQGVSLKSRGNEVALHYGSFDRTSGATVTYRRAGLEWGLVATSPSWIARTNESTKSAIVLVVKEGLNERPTLWAKDSLTGNETKLWDPNPDFENIEIGQGSVYRWTDRLGRPWTGGLFLPVGYVKGHRYPLVIQTHGFTPAKFVVDGAYPTAMAARALASAGVMVLQVGQGADPSHVGSNVEALDAVQGYEAAIDALDVEGMIEPSKVGIVGFSRTCWYVENALIRTPHRFAAATIADGVSYSYMQYHFFGPSSELMQHSYEQVIGSAPAGDGIAEWVRLAPDFQANKIVAPLRIEAIQPHSILEEWELYSSLKMQGHPVDLIYFPYGQHILQRPSERVASQQGNVDWFRFWLQGYEDPNPKKHEQYERWRQMRQ